MRLVKLLMVLAACSAIVFCQAPAQHGIQPGDLDRAADPCTDFFQYANGTWRAQNPIPASMSRWSRRWQAGELSKDQLKDILQDVSRRHDWPAGSVEQLIGDYYGSCMDEARVNKLGIAPIQPLLADIDKIKDAAGVQRMIGQLHRVAVSVPFGFGSSSDNHRPGQVIADIGASGLGLPDRDYYFKTEPRFQEAREKYRAYVTSMFQLAGYDEARAKAAAATVFQMETSLAGASLDNVTLRDPQATDHKTSFSDLQKLTPALDWNAYFQAAGLPHDDLNVEEPKFLQEVDRQLRETSLADWKTYLKWQLLDSAAGSLSAPFVEASFNFHGRFLNGAKEIKPRWKRCVESTDGLLGEALGQKYVQKYFPPEAKARAQEMVKNILSAMHDTIDGLEWMSPETKKKALEKLSTFNPKIGYPDKWLDYSKEKVRPDAYWANVVTLREFAVRDDRNRIGKPVDRGRWGMTPPTSDAYYNPLLNEIVFPAGILQPPAFSMDATDAVNYGSIGVVIGHEISHGFDDQGAQYDSLGALHNWWTADDLKNFQARTACVAKQFDGYFIEPTIHHNGKLVTGESIGDLAGAKIAYLAFKKSQQGKPPSPALDGFTPDQQFFIAWGQWRGDETRPEAQRTMIQGDPHPVAKFRVIGPLSNLKEFQQAFSCKPASAMVRPPGERCEVW
ncbi:MAG TPA: M13 family metallopeptidase [Verrucomicrobiae bacterium]|nr:M13 family metallopeptidase [Verrucomicrobiae bacterium]